MLNRLREQLGTAGLVVAVVALVAAMAGGAYAASGGLNPKQKKEVKKIAKSYQGQGPAGPAGAAGAKGDAGAAGANGSNGSNGKDGVSAETATFNGNLHGCAEGGVEVKSASPVAYVCNGKKGTNGTTGFTDTLPSEKTETGVWSVGHIEERLNYPGIGKPVQVPISFSIPLESDLAGSRVHIILQNGKELDIAFQEVVSTACTGTVAEPTATPGDLCIYAGTELFDDPTENPPQGILIYQGTSFVNPATGQAGASKVGMTLRAFAQSANVEAFGTWAVTAE